MIKKKKKPKAPARPLISNRRLLGASWREFTRHWKAYLLIVAVVVVPANLLTLSDSLANHDGFAANATLASIFMNVALVYTAIAALDGNPLPRLREAYYKGSGAVLRFIFASLLLLILLAPAALGATLLSLALSAVPGTEPPLGELLLYITSGLVLILPSFWLFVRFGLSTYAVIQDGQMPVQSLRHSWRLTQGRFLQVLGRFAFLMVVLGFVVAITYIPVLLIGLALRNFYVINSLYEILLSLVTLPLVNLYLLRLYRELKPQPEPPANPESKPETQPEAS